MPRPHLAAIPPSRDAEAPGASSLAGNRGGAGGPLPGPRKDKRALILDAAIKVFAAKGYHGSRVSDIAREADIAYGLVYHYFKNKEEILHSIFDERWTGFLEVVEEIARRDTSTEDRLVSVAALILNAYRVRPDWVKVLVLEIQRSSRFAEPGQLRAVGALFQSIARILRTGQERGELRPELDPDVACYVFVGALEIVVTSLVLDLIQVDGKPPTDSEYYLKVARTVVDIFLNGLARKAEPPA
ncbi:MAG TPA: TetR/AcrR family transcriptional regulator [Myxococcota bacterium]|jgi:AcrR family transcriptional regulator|nr:TetR/AcrR family transcriptional regulator [Myxococcota bacterium]